jgi:hypothetical protein
MSNKKSSFWMTPKGLAALSLIGAASYFLLVEHRQHVWQYLPFLILLACPFMHVFMHGGHNHGSGDDDHSSNKKDESDQNAYQRGLQEGRKKSEHRHD